MLKLGQMQELEIKRFTSVGAFLNVEEGKGEDILLPKSQIPPQAQVGDRLEVFIYRDSKDRIIATKNTPKIQLGQLAHLQLISSTKIGHFLDWGLERDLFMPFSETIGSPVKGKSYLVGLYIDKSDRLCATMRIKDFLSNDSPYRENKLVEGTIYSIHKDLGVFVAIEDKYDGLIPKREVMGAYDLGQKIEVRISRVLEDGKLELSLRDRSYIQMEEDSRKILEKLKENQGYLDLNDKSSPAQIRKSLQMSKSAFKRAIGKLLKEDIIAFRNNGIGYKD